MTFRGHPRSSKTARFDSRVKAPPKTDVHFSESPTSRRNQKARFQTGFKLSTTGINVIEAGQ